MLALVFFIISDAFRNEFQIFIGFSLASYVISIPKGSNAGCFGFFPCFHMILTFELLWKSAKMS